MKFSDLSLKIVENMANINTSIVFRKGNQHTVISQDTEIAMTASISEGFPCEVPIYNTHELLNVIRMMNDPDILFKENYLTVTSENYGCKYYYTEAEAIESVKELPKFDELAKFSISRSDLSRLIKAATTLKIQNLFIVKNGNGVFFVVSDEMAREGENSFTMKLPIDQTTLKNMRDFNIKLRSYRLSSLMPSDYYVSVGSRLVSFHNDMTKYIMSLVIEDD